MHRFKTLAVAALTGASVFVAVSLPVGAQTDDGDAGTDSTDSTEEVAPEHERRHHRGLRFGCSEFDLPDLVADEVAEELGITAEELQAAFDAAQPDIVAANLAELEERLAAKVEAGELTQEQADGLLEAAQNCERPDPDLFPGRSDRGRFGDRGRGGGFGSGGPFGGAPDATDDAPTAESTLL